MNVFVIGLGLIGGSMALDIQQHNTAAVVYGIDADVTHANKALSLGIIHHKATMDALPTADVVLVAVPVDVLLDILPEVLDLVSDTAVVVEVGSSKERICATVATHRKRRNLIATHPIAGTEFSGPSAAHTGLFQQKTMIVCEVEKTAFSLQEKALEIFKNLGMRIRYMDPVAHDKHIAYVSHLSHISSFMLGKTVLEKEENERDIFDMAGSGFESTVRLAKSSPAMWAPIFEQNKTNIVASLTEYIRNLEAFKALMVSDQFSEIYKTMEDTHQLKNILNGIVQ